LWRFNNAAVTVLASMLARADRLGFTDPNHYLWFACQWNRLDPAQPIRQWDTAWRAIRDAAGLPGLRFHDLRHTAISELAELGTPDSVLKSLAGHLTQRMLDYYSHIRLKAKRHALEGLESVREEEVRKMLESLGQGSEPEDGRTARAEDVQ
jgi:integrase